MKRPCFKRRNHRSIKLIKSKKKSETIRVRKINADEIKKFIEKLDLKKASQKFDLCTLLKKCIKSSKQMH